MAEVQLLCTIEPELDVKIPERKRTLEVFCKKEEYDKIIKMLDIDIEVYLAKLTDTYLIAGPFKKNNPEKDNQKKDKQKYSIVLFMNERAEFGFFKIVENCLYPYENIPNIANIKLYFNTIDDVEYYNAELRTDYSTNNEDIAGLVNEMESDENRLRKKWDNKSDNEGALFSHYSCLTKLKSIVKNAELTDAKIRLLSLYSLTIEQISNLVFIKKIKYVQEDEKKVRDHVLKFGKIYASIKGEKIAIEPHELSKKNFSDIFCLLVYDPKYVGKMELLLYFTVSRNILFFSNNEKILIFSNTRNSPHDRLKKLKNIGIERLLH